MTKPCARSKDELGFAPHRIIKPQCRDRANQRIGPGLDPHAARAARAQIGPLFPIVALAFMAELRMLAVSADPSERTTIFVANQLR
jgi:hypothetical protein